MEKAVKDDKPFYCYFNHSLMHFPMSPRDEFVGKSDNGDWGDCLLMLDHDFGVLLDKLDELGVADNTIVVMCGDNGAEDHLAGRGTGGFFDGSYFARPKAASARRADPLAQPHQGRHRKQ